MVIRTSNLTTTLILASAVGFTTLSAHADIRTHADYIAIDVEGEENISKDDRWILTEPTTPSQAQDPDGNHSDTAVGNAYLELLPDIRVTHNDPFGPPTAIWGAAGTGPEMNFMVDFPEAGQYFVHVRALSTGSEDNGIHVGINDDWPVSGERMQWCTNGRGWQWSSRQRDSGGAGPCGASHTITIDVPSPGTHRVNFSAREDGFEFDRFILIKDLSNNTRICQPNNENDISCRNGSLESSDDVVDLGVQIAANPDTVKTGEEVDFTLTVINEDNFDTAGNVEVNVAAGIGTDWEVVSMDEVCLSAGTDLVCELGSIIPSSPDELDHSYSFTLRALAFGTSTLNANISSADTDNTPANDSASVNVTVESSIPLTTLSTDLTGDFSLRPIGEPLTPVLEITNTGVEPALAVRASIVIPEGLTVDDQPDNCLGTTVLECDFGDISADETARLDLSLTSTTNGIKTLMFTPSADNLEEEAASFQRSVFIVEALGAINGESDNTGDDADDSAGDSAGDSVDETTGSGGATSFLLLTGLIALAMGRRRYKPTMARLRTA